MKDGFKYTALVIGKKNYLRRVFLRENKREWITEMGRRFNKESLETSNGEFKLHSKPIKA